MAHTFLSGGRVNICDVAEIIRLTLERKLSWVHSSECTAFSAQPVSPEARGDQKASRADIGENIRGIRIGYHPIHKGWHYLRLADETRRHYYVEGRVPVRMQDAVGMLFSVVKASADGTLDPKTVDRRKLAKLLK